MSGWIPQVYYDFLARLVPGSAVIVGAFYLRHGPSRGIGFVLRAMCDQDQSWVCRFGVGLLAAYLIGLILGELGELLAGRALGRRDAELEKGFVRECLDDHSRALEAVGRAPVTLLPDDLPATDLMAEQLTIADHYSGSRLLALRAERRLCLVLAFGLFMLVVGNLLAYSADLVLKRLAVEGLLLLAMLVLWRRSTRLHERVVRKTCIGWLTKILSGGFSGSAS
ncbi:MAG: hypothetical protein KAW67_05045 [Candidatus Eisenbacteria sp.]|nr:hypothetical protein [Candidatus Eisenbacteria bacterium]